MISHCRIWFYQKRFDQRYSRGREIWLVCITFCLLFCDIAIVIASCHLYLYSYSELNRHGSHHLFRPLSSLWKLEWWAWSISGNHCHGTKYEIMSGITKGYGVYHVSTGIPGNCEGKLKLASKSQACFRDQLDSYTSSCIPIWRWYKIAPKP